MREWVKEKLRKYNGSVDLVYGDYNEYVNQGGTSTLESFKRSVRKIASSEKNIAEQDNIKVALNKKLGDSRLLEEIRILKAENKMLLNNESSIQKLVDIVEKAVVVYKPFQAPEVVVREVKEDSVAIFHISDTHMGEVVSLKDTLNLNEYNTLITKERLDKYFAKALKNSLEVGAKDAVILFGGDLISGIIHDEIIRNSDATVVETILELSDYLSQQIRNLTKYFKNIRVIATVGNHGRILQGKPYYAEFDGLNFETIILHFIKKELRDIVSEFIIPDGIITVFDVFGKNYCLTHGNIFKGGNGFSLVPNTIPRDSAKLSGFLPKVDAFFIGHFHVPFISQSFVGGIPVYCNGTTMGANAYSIANFKTVTPPSQNFYVLTKEDGIKYYCEIKV